MFKVSRADCLPIYIKTGFLTYEVAQPTLVLLEATSSESMLWSFGHSKCKRVNVKNLHPKEHLSFQVLRSIYFPKS